jgi:hypothetical protein
LASKFEKVLIKHTKIFFKQKGIKKAEFHVDFNSGKKVLKNLPKKKLLAKM